MKLRYGDVGRKNKNINKAANKRPKAPLKAVVLLSGALAAGAVACGNKAEDMPQKAETQVIYETDSEGLADLSERDALLAQVMKDIMRNVNAKLPLIDYPQGEVNVQLNENKESKADFTFVAFVNKKKEEEPKSEDELSGKDQLAEMGCAPEVTTLGTADAMEVPVAMCYDLASVNAVCEAACEEKNPKSKEKKKPKEEGSEEEEEKSKEKESKDEVMEFCINSCFGGALVNLFKTSEYLEAQEIYKGLLGNGHCDDDQWARVRVILYETDESGNILKYDLKGNMVTYDFDGNILKYDKDGNQVVKKDDEGNIVEYTEKDMQKAKPVVVEVQVATILVGTEQGIDQECPKGKGGKSEPLTMTTLVGGAKGQ